METNKDTVIILKNAGTTCNIGCIYCAEARKSKTVSKSISIEDIKQLIEVCKKEEHLTILFHGGEPTLLPISYYEEIMSYCKAMIPDIEFGFQTNATLLNDEWIEFFKRNKEHVGISVSLDGSPKMNSYRRTKNGEFVFDQIYDGIRLLESNGILTGMISTITQAALGHENELMDLIKSFTNIRFLKINPCFDLWEDGSIPEWGIKPDEYSEFVCNFFDLMISNKIFSKVDVEPMLSIIKNIEGLSNSYCNYTWNKCNNFISLYPDGIITSCDNFGITEGTLGNIYKLNKGDCIKNIINFKYNNELCNKLDSLLESCDGCEAKTICSGGCLAARKRYESYFQGDRDIYCKSMKKTINHINGVLKRIKMEE